MKADNLNWRVERLCLAARPAAVSECAGGWLFRRSGGRIRQANSVNPLDGPRGDPSIAIKRGERYYMMWGQVPLFRVPTIADEMDAELDRLGYGIEGRTVTLFNPLQDVALPRCHEVVMAPEPWPAWLEARARMSGDLGQDDEAYRRMVLSIALPRAFAAVSIGSRIVSIAYGVVNDRLLVLESVMTDADFRQRGLARKTLHGLMSWSRAQGVGGACLQVVADNMPARALYTSAGFDRELYRYHYRRKSPTR